MSDILLPIGDGVHYQRFKDMGDGSYARVVITGTEGNTMSDFLSPLGDGTNKVRFRDMGDGSVAEVISVANANAVNPETWPMRLPVTLGTAPFTRTAGVVNAASQIANSKLFSALDGANVTVLGGPQRRDYVYPNYLANTLGTYPYITTSSPVAVEFTIDTTTGQFELFYTGAGQQYRVLVKQADGSWGTDGNIYTMSTGLAYDLFTMAAGAGRYQVRIEFQGARAIGIQAAKVDTVTGLPKRRKRLIVVGDSFTEPTIVDSGAKFAWGGWVQVLAHLTGYDCWSAGIGGTGYVNANTPASKVKFFDRLAQDVFPFVYPGDKILFAGGINDPMTSQSDIDTLTAQVAACFAAAKDVTPDVMALSPFFPYTTVSKPSATYSTRDIIKAQAAKYGVRFLDLMNYGGIPAFLRYPTDYSGFSTTLAAPYSSGTSISVNDVPGYFKTGSAVNSNAGKTSWWVQIGSGISQAVAEINNMSGSAAPYNINATAAIPTTFPAGTPVTLTGQSYQTGTGKQGSTTGDGNSDRYTGSDGTHPTMAGHPNIAFCVAELMARSIAGRTV